MFDLKQNAEFKKYTFFYVFNNITNLNELKKKHTIRILFCLLL